MKAGSGLSQEVIPLLNFGDVVSPVFSVLRDGSLVAMWYVPATVLQIGLDAVLSGHTK